MSIVFIECEVAQILKIELAGFNSWQLGFLFTFLLWFLLPEHYSSPRKCYLSAQYLVTLKLLNCNFKKCVWLWQHGFFPTLEKSGLDPSSRDFIYYGKTWNGKKYLFTNVKIVCRLIWETVCHLNFIQQHSSLSFCQR